MGEAEDYKLGASGPHQGLNTRPLFKLMVERRASDLFFTSNAPIKIKIEGQIHAVNKQVQLSVGVDNLFDRTYSEHLNLAGNAGFGYAANTAVNEPGRTFWARLSFKY